MRPNLTNYYNRLPAAFRWMTAVFLLAGLVTWAPVTLASAPAPDQATAQFEVDFLQEMIEHHAMAVEMGQMCLEKAVHEELRTLCEQIVTTQSQEIALMQSWLADWYGVSYRPEMKPGDQHQMEKLAAVSGAEFEIEFMQRMIKHHEKAIRESEQCLDRAYHPDLLDVCSNIIATQSAEIELMQAWLCEWYAICKQA